MRPLTVHSFVSNNKLSLLIPTIVTSSLKDKDFIITCHELKTRSESSTNFKFKENIKYKIFTFNN